MSNESLRPKQRRALGGLLSGLRFDDAARAAGVSSRTLRRWRGEAAFAAVLEAEQGRVFAEAQAMLRGASVDAAGYLRDVVSGDAEANGTARISAAKAILEHAARGVEREDLLHRLENLEAGVADRRTAA